MTKQFKCTICKQYHHLNTHAPLARFFTPCLSSAFLFFLLCFLCVLPPPARAQSQPQDAAIIPGSGQPVRELRHILEPIRERAKLPALAAVVVEGPSVFAQGNVGVRAIGSPEPVGIMDTFHLGSCTKSMTATMIARLVDEKKMRWDMTIAEVFPERAEKIHEKFRATTLEQLLTNRGGLPGDVPRKLWSELWKRTGTPTEQRLQLLDGLLDKPPAYDPGTKNVYSNSNFAVAGAMAERVTCEPWESLMQRLLFEPLGMTSAGFGAPGDWNTPDTIDQPRGHTAKGGLLSAKKFTPVPPGPSADNPPAIGPAGTVHANLYDWAKYIALHLAAERALIEDRPADDPAFALVSKDSWAVLHRAIAGSGDASKPSDTSGYAMGWVVTSRPWGDGRVLMHNGSNTMWFCVVWIAPKKNFAVLVATNAAEDAPKACDQAVWALVQEQLKQP